MFLLTTQEQKNIHTGYVTHTHTHAFLFDCFHVFISVCLSTCSICLCVILSVCWMGYVSVSLRLFVFGCWSLDFIFCVGRNIMYYGFSIIHECVYMRSRGLAGHVCLMTYNFQGITSSDPVLCNHNWHLQNGRRRMSKTNIMKFMILNIWDAWLGCSVDREPVLSPRCTVLGPSLALVFLVYYKYRGAKFTIVSYIPLNISVWGACVMLLQLIKLFHNYFTLEWHSKYI